MIGNFYLKQNKLPKNSRLVTFDTVFRHSLFEVFLSDIILIHIQQKLIVRLDFALVVFLWVYLPLTVSRNTR